MLFRSVVIGWISVGTRKANLSRLQAFKEGMTSFGWKEGANYILEERWAEADYERLPEVAREIAGRKPAVVVATPTVAAREMHGVAPNLPIVLASGDPIVVGLSNSLAKPSGMVTGVSNINVELGAKLVELLRDASPKVRQVGVLVDGKASALLTKERMAVLQQAAAATKIQLVIGQVFQLSEVDAALSSLAKRGAQALIVPPSSILNSDRPRIAKFALANGWPLVAGEPEYADAGALAAYSADRVAMYRRAAYFVDRLLKGAKVSDLPIEQPMYFETIVNLRTAKALGIKVPPIVMVRATRVIE